VKYGAEYDWLALPLASDTTWNPFDSSIQSIHLVDNPLGNTLNNDQNINFNTDLNFRNLYNKWKFLKPYNTSASSGSQPKGDDKTKKDTKDTKDTKDQKKNNQPVAKGGLGLFIRPIISLKKVTFTYTQNKGTTLPGFVYKARNFGQDLRKTAPGWDFVLGMQPDTNWLNNAAKKGWITQDTNLNYQLIQNYNRNITARAQFEPIKDVNVDINFMKNYSYNTTEFFKNTDFGFQHLNQQAFGNYSVSFIALNTAFQKPDTNGHSPTFNLFQDYRQTVSQRLAQNNPEAVGPYYNPQDSSYNANFANGYGPYSQDVLIPSFLAAYAGKDVNTVGLYKYFHGIPAPNWRITYNGLTKMKWAKKIWNSLNISHGYSSTLTISSFTSALEFNGNATNGINIPNRIDSVSGNFISFFDIPSIGITEQFSPLIGIDAQWKNNVSTKFEYKKGRNLAMSFLDYQLVESRTSEITIGAGYKWKNAPIPFKIQGKKKRLKNDLNLKCDVSLSNNITTNYKLDQAVSTPTQGMKTISISPSAEYMVNSKLNIRLFVDKRYSIPATSSSYPIRYLNAGVTIRFTLAQ
jgi:cell surface protein SprA